MERPRGKNAELLSFRLPTSVADALLERALAEDRPLSYVLREIVTGRREPVSVSEGERNGIQPDNR